MHPAGETGVPLSRWSSAELAAEVITRGGRCSACPLVAGCTSSRVRGTDKVAADFSLLAAAINLARLSVLGITRTSRSSWSAATA